MGLQYRWFYIDPYTYEAYKSSVTGSTYSTTMTWEKDGREVFCVITDKGLNSVATDVVTLRVD